MNESAIHDADLDAELNLLEATEGGEGPQGTRAITAAEVDRIAARMLAELAVAERADLGPLADPDMSRGRKLGLMVGGALGLTALLLVVFAVLGTRF